MDVNPEYLSDGRLYESAKFQKQALAADPDGNLKDFANRRDALEDGLAGLDISGLYNRIDALIGSCKKALTELLENLPKDGALFPDASERSLVASPVAAFCSALEPLQKTEWELLSGLSDKEHELLSSHHTAELLFASLSPAISAAKGLPIEEALRAEYAKVEAVKADLEDRSAKLNEAKERLTTLHKIFFGSFLAELSLAADLEHDGKAASPAAVLRLLGEARHFLFS